MNKTYRVMIQGVKEGFAVEKAVRELVTLFKKTPEEIRRLLATKGTVVKKGVDRATADKYRDALEQRGCICLIEAEGMQDSGETRASGSPGAVPTAEDFSRLNLRKFVSPTIGLVFDAPASWHDNSDEDLFQVIDPQTDTQFAASAYENPGLSLQQWGTARLGMVNTKMPFLRPVTAPYEMKGVAWTGIAAEYRGVFPGNDYETYYLVLCLRTDELTISFTIAARNGAFEKNHALYYWLLRRQLDIYKVERVSADSPRAAELHNLAAQGSASSQSNMVFVNGPTHDHVPNQGLQLQPIEIRAQDTPTPAIESQPSANPYATPSASVANSWSDDATIRDVARYQRLVLMSIPASFASNGLVRVSPGLLTGLLVLGIGIFSIWAIYRLCRALDLSAIFWAILMFVPLFNLLGMLYVNQKATRFLKDQGISVGLIGAKV